MTLEINTEFECLNKDFELDIEPTTAFALALLEKVKADNDETEENIKAHTEKTVKDSVTALKENAANAVKGCTSLSSSISLENLDISPFEHVLKVVCNKESARVFAHSENLIETVSVNGGYGLSSVSGNPYPDYNLAYTDFIEIQANKNYMIYWSYQERWIVFYDENQNVIGAYRNYEGNDIVDGMFVPPTNAKYARMVFNTTERESCYLYEGEIYTANSNCVVEGIMSTIPYTNLVSLAEGVSIQAEYNIDTNAKTAELEKAIKNNNANMDGMNKNLGIHTEQIAGIIEILKAIQTMSIDVDRPTGNTITVEPETIYFCDSGSNENLISFTQDSDDNIETGRIVLMVVGKEYAYKNQYTLAYVVKITKGVLSPSYNAWSFLAIRKDTGHNTKISFPDGSTIVKIKNVAKG